MRLSRSLKLTCGAWLALAGQTAFAQLNRGGNCCQPSCSAPCQPAAPATPGTPDQPPKVDPAQPPMVQPNFAPEQAAAGGGDNYAMNMIGDFFNASHLGFISSQASFLATNQAKYAVNQSPLPRDRVYADYSFYDNVLTKLPLTPIDVFVLNLGMEKTFLDGNASIGIVLPIDQQSSFGTTTAFGDLSLILKALLIHDCDRAVSAGVMVTLPTGPNTFADTTPIFIGPSTGTFHTTTIQPFVGCLRSGGDLYVQGFTSLAIPVDSNIPAIWFVDVGAGYWLCHKDQGCGGCGNCGCGVTGVVATLELHANIPLKQNSLEATPVGIPDSLVVVGGIILPFGRSSALTFGLGEPISGPKPYEIEGIVQFNLWF